jgi:hypothetical protein
VGRHLDSAAVDFALTDELRDFVAAIHDFYASGCRSWSSAADERSGLAKAFAEATGTP